MHTLLPISYLNDFVFCPYSIYLHQVFEEGKEETYSAKPQQQGRSAHENIDHGIRKDRYLQAAYVICEELGIYGRIDRYEFTSNSLIERKRTVHKLYRGFYYQVWAQYYGMIEMGYQVDQIIVESVTDKRRTSIPIPTIAQQQELQQHIERIRSYDPLNHRFMVNINKCKHCIYAALCDKTHSDHVYS